jgi:hypothetical protein
MSETKSRIIKPVIDPNYKPPVRPFETIWSDCLFEVRKRYWFVIHAYGAYADYPGYDAASYGDLMEWRGVLWQRGLDDRYNSLYRLHDDETERVAWVDVGSLTGVTEDELEDCRSDPLAWLDMEYTRHPG